MNGTSIPQTLIGWVKKITDRTHVGSVKDTTLRRALMALKSERVCHPFQNATKPAIDFGILTEDERSILRETIFKQSWAIDMILNGIQNIPIHELCQTGLPLTFIFDKKIVLLATSSQIPGQDHTAQLFYNNHNFEINFTKKIIECITHQKPFIARDADKSEAGIRLSSETYGDDFLTSLAQAKFTLHINGQKIDTSGYDNYISQLLHYDT